MDTYVGILTILYPMVTIAILGTVVGLKMRPPSPSKLALTVTVLPAFITILLFYSLAAHMHQSLGAWPTSIGERGFPPALLRHAYITESFFTVFILISIFLWPVAFVLCLSIKRIRKLAFYLGIYALSFMVCLLSMLLAPQPFLKWWMD